MKFTRPIGDLTRSILEKQRAILNRKFQATILKAELKLQQFTVNYLKTTKTYHELTSGKLVGHFGFEQGTEYERVDTIVQYFAERVKIKFNKFKITSQGLEGSVYTTIDKSVLQYLVSKPEALILTEKGRVLPWLAWLLYGQNQIQVIGHHILFKTAGRSGQAIMVPKGQWSVPLEYSGTLEGGNWFTDALSDGQVYIDKMYDLLEQELR